MQKRKEFKLNSLMKRSLYNKHTWNYWITLDNSSVETIESDYQVKRITY